jgi:hypothetical protein
MRIFFTSSLLSFFILLMSIRPVFASLQAQVVAGEVINGEIKPISQDYLSAITTQQDTGYFLRLKQDNVPVSVGLQIEFSSRISPDSWSAWNDFKVGNVFLTPDSGGIITIDYTLWGKVPLGVAIAKFRIKDQAEESNSISVTTEKINAEDYFIFNPGNWAIYKGCLENVFGDYVNCSPDKIYKVRLNVENQATAGITYHGITKLIVSNPLRWSQSSNVPISWSGGEQDYKTFLSTGFNDFGINTGDNQIKWNLKTPFYEKLYTPVLQKLQKHTAIFFDESVDNPGYFIIRKKQDIQEVYNSTFQSLRVDDANFYDGDVSSKVTTVYDHTGWRVSFRLIKVNYPAYSGTALRVRYLEYGTNNGTTPVQDSVSYNYDEWIFGKKLGLIAVNNKYHRAGDGKTCADDPDCMDLTNVMESPMFSVSIFKYKNYDDNESVDLDFGRNNNFSHDLIIIPGETYQIKVTNSLNGQPFTGFLEIQGNYLNNNGQNVNIPKQVFKDKNRQPVWVEEGLGNVQTASDSEFGKYSIQVRPFIFTDQYKLVAGSEVGANRLAWSNLASVAYCKKGDFNCSKNIDSEDLTLLMFIFNKTVENQFDLLVDLDNSLKINSLDFASLMGNYGK